MTNYWSFPNDMTIVLCFCRVETMFVCYCGIFLKQFAFENESSFMQLLQLRAEQRIRNL